MASYPERPNLKFDILHKDFEAILSVIFSSNDYSKIKKDERPNQNYHQNRNTPTQQVFLPTVDAKIVNISSTELSINEITLLEKGMKFPPTSKQNTKELKDDLQEFGRKLRLLEHFNDHQQQLDASLVKNKSNFVPSLTNDKLLQMILETYQTYTKTQPAIQKGAILILKKEKHWRAQKTMNILSSNKQTKEGQPLLWTNEC